MRIRVHHVLPVIMASILIAAMGVFGVAPAVASEGCLNEQVRRESNTDPATSEAYSAGLPDCRAYEMVSPPEKNNGGIYAGSTGFPVAVDGDAVGFFSQNGFGDAENALTGGCRELLHRAAHRLGVDDIFGGPVARHARTS